ncbi:hypothetical protein DBA29_20330 [Xenophilus aerolatus]|nr:hypothetical protein [Xenophilus aerolatus]
MTKLLTIVLVCAHILGCGVKTEVDEPADVTMQERKQFKHCVEQLSEHWPENYRVVYQSIERDKDGGLDVGVNMAFKFNQQRIDQIVAKGGVFAGHCVYRKDGTMMMATRSDAVKRVFQIATDFNYGIFPVWDEPTKF